ncbi:MAG: hypothetical protein ACO3IB_10480, partial [Phycisphaerales bacterium]
ALLDRAAAGEAAISSGQRAGMAFFSLCRAALPNFQLFWLSDALTQKKAIPAEYIGYAVPYALAMVTALLSLATMLFQRREVG